MSYQADVRDRAVELRDELDMIIDDILYAISEDEPADWPEIYSMLECQSGTIAAIMQLIPEENR